MKFRHFLDIYFLKKIKNLSIIYKFNIYIFKFVDKFSIKYELLFIDMQSSINLTYLYVKFHKFIFLNKFNSTNILLSIQIYK